MNRLEVVREGEITCCKHRVIGLLPLVLQPITIKEEFLVPTFKTEGMEHSPT